MLVINCVRQTWFFGRSRERAGRVTGSDVILASQDGVSEIRHSSGVAHPRPESVREKTFRSSAYDRVR